MMMQSKKMKTVLSNHHGLNEMCANGQKSLVLLSHMNIGSANKKETGADAHLYFKYM